MNNTTHWPRLIGLYSPVPQSGKSSLAGFLGQHGYTCMSHAEPIKSMVDTLLGESLGAEPLAVKATRGPDKDRPLATLGCTRRTIERALGVGMREHVAPDFWSDILINRTQSSPTAVVVDDVRFPNEYDAIREAGGQVWRIERPASPSWHMADYESESRLEDRVFDAKFVNGLEYTQLLVDVEAYLSTL